MVSINRIFLLLFLLLFTIVVNAQSNNLVGVGFSYHHSYISRLTTDNYLPEDNTATPISATNIITPKFSYSIKYGRVLTPSVIFFTGIEKIGHGQKFNVDLIEFNNATGPPSQNTGSAFTEITYNIEIELEYLKIPFTLYWKMMKKKPFGPFVAFSIDAGILTSAKLIQNGVKLDYKENLNPVDINYKFILGMRYDTDKYLFNLGVGYGNGFSDVEKKEKIGVTVQEPAHNILVGYFLSLNRKF